MTKNDKDSEREEAERDAILKNLLATPPQQRRVKPSQTGDDSASD